MAAATTTLATEAGLRTAWQSEGVFMQSMAFSLVLVTLAFSFLHLSKRRLMGTRFSAGLALATVLGLLALGFGSAALCGFALRSRRLNLGGSLDGGVHAVYVGLGACLLLVEAVFMVVALASGPK